MSEALSCRKVCQPGGCNEPLGFALAKFHGRIVAIHAYSSLERSLDSRKKKLLSRKNGENEKRKNYSIRSSLFATFFREIAFPSKDLGICPSNESRRSILHVSTDRQRERGRQRGKPPWFVSKVRFPAEMLSRSV